MAYNIIANISLDLYNDNFVIVNAKQGDSESRYIEVTATEYGIPYFVDKDTVVAYIRCCKPDGKYCFNKAIVLDTGKVLIKLTEQMLAAFGKGVIDLTLTSIFTEEILDVDITSDIVIADDGIGNATLDIQSVAEGETTIGEGTRISILSTMSFYLNICKNPIDGVDIESTSEYNALNDMLIRISKTEESFGNTFNESISGLEEIKTDIQSLNDEVRSNENERIESEKKRESDVANAIANMEKSTNTSLDQIETAINNANTATNNANSAASTANMSAQNADVATENANTATISANNAADRANLAAENCEGIADTTGVVLKTRIADNLETTDGEYVLSAKQGSILYGITDSLRLRIEELHKVWSGTEDPNIDDGSNRTSKNGDIYMQIIEG